jgi:hypothetical protein
LEPTLALMQMLVGNCPSPALFAAPYSFRSSH